ncbi:hypothetical protein K3001_15675, partial [Pseudomonas aeruginosa]|nr:hypothetical protein [Pseudomonas aeruginosa]
LVEGVQRLVATVARLLEAADTELRARDWQAAPLRVSVRPPRPVLLDAEWIGAPLRITLSDGQHSVTVLREANGHVRVH